MANNDPQRCLPLLPHCACRPWRTVAAMFLLALLGACATPSGKEGPSQPEGAQQRHEASAEPDQPIIGPLPMADRLLVEKSKRQLTILRHGHPIRIFHVSLGAHPTGHKVEEGDGRTPEGTYFLDWRNPQSKYFLAFHVSYPNKKDTAHARKLGVAPGGEIMVHGYGKLPRGVNTLKGVDWTNGCIAISNEEMAEIWRIVPDGTPIEIRP